MDIERIIQAQDGKALHRYLQTKAKEIHGDENAAQCVTQLLEQAMKTAATAATTSSLPTKAVLATDDVIEGEYHNISVMKPKCKCNWIFNPKQWIFTRYNTTSRDLLTPQATPPMKNCAFAIEWNRVKRILKLPDVNPATKAIFFVYVIELNQEEMENSRPIHWFDQKSICAHIIFRLPKCTVPVMEEKKSGAEANDRVIEKLIKAHGVTILDDSGDDLSFKSSLAKPYIKCYWKTSPGALYLTHYGLVFYSPYICIPIDKIQKISFGRQGASRTFDVSVDFEETGANNKCVEFTMIEREEYDSVRKYFNQVMELKANADTKETTDSATSQEKAQQQENEDVDDEYEDDESFVMDSDESSVSTTSSFCSETEDEEENGSSTETEEEIEQTEIIPEVEEQNGSSTETEEETEQAEINPEPKKQIPGKTRGGDGRDKKKVTPKPYEQISTKTLGDGKEKTKITPEPKIQTNDDHTVEKMKVSPEPKKRKTANTLAVHGFFMKRTKKS